MPGADLFFFGSLHKENALDMHIHCCTDQTGHVFHRGLYALLHRLLPQMAYKTKKPTDETVVKARKYMEIDPKLSIAEIARNCGLSESGLYAAFRQQGTTPVEFRQRLLCEKAVTLLISTDMTVENVSDTLGFSTPSYFRRVLKKHFGKTPKEIRSNIPI